MSNTSKTVTKPAASRDGRIRRPATANDIQVHPSDLGPLFAKRPLILGEDPNDYDSLMSQVIDAVRPTDIFEAMWVKDVVDDMWDTLRLKRHKTSLYMTEAKEVLVRILTGARHPETERIIDAEYAHTIAVCCLQGDEEAVSEVKDLLTDYGFDFDSIMAEALANKLRVIEWIDEAITAAAAGRNRTLRHVEQHREARDRRLRRVADDIEDIASPIAPQLLDV
jgi:hypothetical protein